MGHGLSSVQQRVAIVGAGYAGLAAATELAAQGHSVTVFEASRTLGGRARAVEVDGQTLDNGAHILAGAYSETLRLMALVGADPDTLLKRIPLTFEFPGHLRLAAPRLPAPLHLAAALLFAQGLSWADKWAAIRFMRTMESARFRLPADQTVASLLYAHNQPPNLRRLLWEPLCIAALNTGADTASAQVFLNVLRDSLAAKREASDLLLPATDFSTLFPEPAAAYVERRGGQMRRACRIETLQHQGNTWQLGHAAGSESFDQVILAVAPYHLPKLLADLPEMAPIVAQVSAFTWEPIVTVYLGYPAHVTLPAPMLGLLDSYGQWLFDRGQLVGQAGVIACVISAHGRHEDLSAEQLAQHIHEEIRRLRPNLPPPLWQRVIKEQRATFACTPALPRPTTQTPLPGLWLAGDYVTGDYPATLEGAVRSGVAAANLVERCCASPS